MYWCHVKEIMSLRKLAADGRIRLNRYVNN